MFRYLASRRMVGREEVGGPHLCCVRSKGVYRQARLGEQSLLRVRCTSLYLSSLLSTSSKNSKRLPSSVPPSLRKSGSKEHVFDMSALNRAIPGPGDEIESDPDAGVKDSEKVSVVFLVSLVGPGCGIAR
jgi:hypothetical protein